MPKKLPDALQIWKQMEDLVVPRLRITLPERAVCYHLLRHSRLEGRRRLHFSMAWLSRGTRVSPGALRAAIRSLSAKGLLRILERSKAGHFVEVRLPGEFRLARLDSPTASPGDLDGADFLVSMELRKAIHRRENGRCFYCLRMLTPGVQCLDHVVPRVRLGANSYRNLVSACLECNSQKSQRPADNFLRELYRQRRLTSLELAERLRALKLLAEGKLKPALNESLVHPERSRRVAAPPTIGKRGRPRLHPAVNKSLVHPERSRGACAVS